MNISKKKDDKKPVKFVDITDKNIPKWYKRGKREKLRKFLITGLMKEYARPLNIEGKKQVKPSEKDVESYKISLDKMSLKELVSMTGEVNIKLRLDITDRIRKLNKKQSCLVTVINDNNTFDTFVMNNQKRTFDRAGNRYILDTSKAIFNPEFRLLHMHYFYGNPFPIEFVKTKLPEATPDGQLLKKTMHFEYLQALAQVTRFSKRVDIAMVFSILSFIISAVHLVLYAHQSGMF